MGVLERDAGARRDGGEELQVLAGEDAEVALAAEADEAGEALVDAEGDADLPAPRANSSVRSIESSSLVSICVVRPSSAVSRPSASASDSAAGG